MMIKNDVFHIYMAEDDADDQQIFKDAIASLQENIKITMFSNGLELLNKLQAKTLKPNVIFLDLFMPILNGEETLTEIRKSTALDDIPVVIFSNLYDIDRISNLFQNGANRYLHKPNSIKTLTFALKRTIESVKNNTLGGTAIINYVE